MEEVASEGGINVPMRPHAGTSVPEYVDLVQASLLKIFKPGYVSTYGNHTDDYIIGFINKTLSDNNAIVAGGFLLDSINNHREDNVDVDMYVPCRNLVNFNKTMAKLGECRGLLQHYATVYCHSFLKMNGIRSVQAFYNVTTNKHIMDIMAVRNSRSPLDVVQNFDLTFCQIWYDGTNVFATHPDHIISRKGYLQKDYVPLLMNRNIFLIKRLEKYKKRGYIITAEGNSIELTSNIIGSTGVRAKKIIKDESFYKKWYSRALFRFIIYLKYKIKDFYLRYNNIKFNSKIEKVFNKEPVVVMTRAELFLPLNRMKNFDPTDGYDSDDFNVEDEKTYYPILDKYSTAIDIDKRAEWLAQTPSTKFRKCIRALMESFYSTNPGKNPFPFLEHYDSAYYGNNDETKRIKLEIKRVGIIYNMFDINYIRRPINPVRPIHHDNPIKYYIMILNKYSKREGSCAISLDDVHVYDLHSHTLDQSICLDELKNYLKPMINIKNKNTLPCYIKECRWFLSLDEIRAIVDKDFYVNFTKPVLIPPEPLLERQGLGDNPGEAETKVDLIDIIKNTPSLDRHGFGNIYHDVLCPFCLSYIRRDSGCTYVTHPSNGRPGSMAPFCKERNIVEGIRNKYININPDDPATNAPYPDSYLEVCSECGRPCNHHVHYDLNDPPGFAPPRLTAGGAPDYGRCAGGGRAELFARIIAIRDLVKGAGDMDPKDLRVAAALAADAAASDPELLARGAAILAKEGRYRYMGNLNRNQNVEALLGNNPLGGIDVEKYYTVDELLGNNPLNAVVVEGGRRTRRARRRRSGTRKN